MYLITDQKKYKLKIGVNVSFVENLGYAGGNNVGIRRALKDGCEYIFLVNPDVKLQSNSIEKLLEVFKLFPKTGIAGPKILFPDGKIWCAGGIIDPVRYSGGLIGYGEKDAGRFEKISDCDFISGTAIMVKSEVFRKIGLLPEDYFLYYEDVDFCHRARQAGFDVKYVPHSRVVHIESSSTVKGSPLQRYYLARNRLYFMGKYAKSVLKARELIRMPKTLSEHISQRDIYSLMGIRDFLLGRKGRRDYWS